MHISFPHDVLPGGVHNRPDRAKISVNISGSLLIVRILALSLLRKSGLETCSTISVGSPEHV